jgi:hypothetical protein
MRIFLTGGVLKSWYFYVRVNSMSLAARNYNRKLETTKGIGRPGRKWIEDTLRLHNITA